MLKLIITRQSISLEMREEKKYIDSGWLIRNNVSLEMLKEKKCIITMFEIAKRKCTIKNVRTSFMCIRNIKNVRCNSLFINQLCLLILYH